MTLLTSRKLYNNIFLSLVPRAISYVLYVVKLKHFVTFREIPLTVFVITYSIITFIPVN